MMDLKSDEYRGDPRLAMMISEILNIKAEVKEINKKIYGNGREGIIQNIPAIRERLISLEEGVARLNGTDGREGVFAMVVSNRKQLLNIEKRLNRFTGMAGAILVLGLTQIFTFIFAIAEFNLLKQ